MRILIFATLVLVWFAGDLSAQICGCVAPAASESTRPGANEHVVLAMKRKHVRVDGIVRDETLHILSDVLVEVFDNPEHLLLPYPENIEKQKLQRRIAACVVGDDGRFCFDNIPAGKYEIRFSKNGGWKHTSVVVAIAPRDRKATKRPLEVYMHVGT